MDKQPDFIPVVLSIGDGVDPADLEEFIKAVRKFDEEAREQYKGKSIKYFFLPEDLVNTMMDMQNK